MRITAIITPIKSRPLSLPNIIGIGPISMIPLVWTSVLEELDDDCKAVPMNMIRIPSIMIAETIKIMEL